MDGVTADQVDKLSELVAVGTEALGTELLDRIIETGEFERILALPKITFEIPERHGGSGTGSGLGRFSR